MAGKIKIGDKEYTADGKSKISLEQLTPGQTYVIQLSSLRAGAGAGTQVMTNVFFSSMQIPFNFYVLRSAMACYWSDTAVAFIHIAANAFFGALGTSRGYIPLTSFGTPAESFLNTGFRAGVAPTDSWGVTQYPDKTLFMPQGNYASNYSVANPAGFPVTGAITLTWEITIKVA